LNPFSKNIIEFDSAGLIEISSVSNY
jgi:hypothetical protein